LRLSATWTNRVQPLPAPTPRFGQAVDKLPAPGAPDLVPLRARVSRAVFPPDPVAQPPNPLSGRVSQRDSLSTSYVR
jgi:hypothetical protein